MPAPRPRLAALALAVIALAIARPSRAAPELEVPVLAPRGELGELEGARIDRVEVVVEGLRWTQVPAVRTVRPGDALSEATARRAMRELEQTGSFARVTATARRAAEGVTLRLSVLPRRIAASVRVEASGPLDDEEILRETRLTQGGEVTGPALDAARERLHALVAARGYPDAEATIEARESDDPHAVALIVRLVPGAPRAIAARALELRGGAVAPDRALDLEIAALGATYGVGAGDRADEPQLASADRVLEARLRAAGWHRARVDHRLALGPTPRLAIMLELGPKLVARYEGQSALDAAALDEVLDLEREVDRSAVHLVAKLREAYVRRGMLDAEVTVEERGGPADRVHVLAFAIRERAQVRVASRTFPCLAAGAVTAGEIEREIDAYLGDELPGGGLSAPDPAVVEELVGAHGATIGARRAPLVLDPSRTFAADTYDRSLKHVQDYLRSLGYLSATAGPVTVVRRACDRRSPPGECRPLPLAVAPTDACRFDALGVPVDDPEPDARLSCQPDPAHGGACEPRVALHVPIKLGPRTTLWDVAFEGNQDRELVEAKLLAISELALGEPVSQVQIESARRRVLDAVKERGYAFAEVRTALELSPDRTRARVRFVVSEGERVYVTEVRVRGARRTDEGLVRRRVALKPCGPRGESEACVFRPSLVRRSEELVAALGTFSSVAVSLEDPQVPARRKAVVVEVQERLPQYLDIRPGFSTGEGFRVTFEYGHRNIAGEAVQLTLRVQLGYLPDPFILDPDVRRNYDGLPVVKRLERRDTVSILFPEVGLGPLVRLGLDGIDVRDNARDFGLTKEAAVATFTYRPARVLAVQLGGSAELNDVTIFNGDTVSAYLQKPGITSDVSRLLRVPDGTTFAVAQRTSVSWDRRDNAFGATRGTLLQLGAEHVHAFPASDNPNTITSDFLRLTGTASAYLKLAPKLSIAASLRAGRITQLVTDSKTYPDRQFFLGGVDSLRGFLQDSVVPEDVAAKLLAPDNQAKSDGDPTKLTLQQVGSRGGDLYLNPRVELRLPLAGSLETALFLDAGNVWVDPTNFDPLRLRYAAGSGLRLATPIGPLAFDYGINLDRRPWEDFGAFHFAIGLY